MADEFNYNDTGNTNETGGTQDSSYANVGSSGTNAANNDGYANGSSHSTGNGNYQYSSNNQGSYGSGNYSGGNGGYYGGSGNGGNGSNDNGGKKKGDVGKALFAVLLAVIFGVCAGAGAFGISRLYNDKDSDDTEVAAITDGDEADDAEDADAADDAEDASENKADLELKSGDEIHTSITEVAETVMPSIVSVYNNYTASQQTYWGTYSQEATSTGSGIIIANTGDELLIATNNHVVADADTLEVQFIDESTAAANLKGTDSGNDLAVIAVSLDDIDEDTKDAIAVASLGNSDDLQLGEPVVAIGNALGYGQSVTTGVVSALNREMTTEDGETGTYIQTDAAINPGNSGGALCDLNGNVIGINSSKIGGSTVEGMGFAIPMSKAEPIIENLASQDTKIAVDEDEQGYLGIAGVSVTSQVSSAYNMPQGAYVAEIYDGTGAADSDLQKGDIITAVNGSTVSSMTDLKEELTYHAAGDEITLTVQRASGSGEYSEQEVKLTLSSKDDMPSEDETSSNGSAQQGQQGGNGSTEEQSAGGQQGGNNWGYQFPWGNFGN